MRKLALAAVSVLGLGLAGCDQVDLPFLPKTKAQLLVGEWECTASDLPAGIKNVTMEFVKGGDLTITMKGDMDQSGMTMHMDVDVDGTYKLDEDTLTLRPKKAHINSITMNGQAVDMSMFGGREAFEGQMASSLEKGEFDIRRLDSDRLTLEEGSNTTKCERA